MYLFLVDSLCFFHFISWKVIITSYSEHQPRGSSSPFCCLSMHMPAEVSRTHHLGTISAIFHGCLLSSFWDISVWSKLLDWLTDWHSSPLRHAARVAQKQVLATVHSWYQSQWKADGPFGTCFSLVSARLDILGLGFSYQGICFIGELLKLLFTH